ncbi:MAG: hypothetical protein RIF41_10375 [Polyangiaceae bacterium]
MRLRVRHPGVLVTALWLGCGTGLIGCGVDDDVPCAHTVCAIRDLSCVVRTSQVVACQRGEAAAVPDVRYLDAAAVLAELEVAEAADPPTPQQEQDLADALRVDALFGLMPDDYSPSQLSADQIANVGAYYDRRTRGITIITDHVGSDPERLYTLLVHELVHFYQDREHDLQALSKQHATTLTRALGLRAVTEGEAELYEDLAHLELDGLTANDVSWTSYFDQLQRDRLELAQQSETPAVDVWGLFPYAWGEPLMLDAWRSGPGRDIAAVYEQPPVSVRQAMAGFGSWPHAFPNDDGAFDPVAMPVLPEAYVPVSAGHASVWLVNACLQRTGQGGLWSAVVDTISAEVVSGFRHEPSQGVVGFWRIRTTDANGLNDAFLDGQWEPWLSEPPPSDARFLVRIVDGDVLLVATSEELDAYAVESAIEGWQSPDEAFGTSDDTASSRWRRGRETWAP